MKQSIREVLVSGGLLLVALAVLTVLYWPVDTIAELVSRVALAILVAGVTRITTAVLFREAREYERFRTLGLREICHPFSSDDLRDRLSNARAIRVLKTWFPEDGTIASGLHNAIKCGAKVKLLLCKPGSTVLQKRSLSIGQGAAWGDRLVYQAIKNIRDVLAVNKTCDVEIRIYDGWPGCPVIWYDDRILMGFYLRREASPFFPWISVTPGSYFSNKLEDQFDDLWNSLESARLDSVDRMDEWLTENEAFQ